MKKQILAVFLFFFLSGTVTAEDILFGDFENEKELSNWKTGFNDKTSKEEPPALSLSKENATSGSSCLMIKFNGGLLPMISTVVFPHSEDLYSYKSLSFDLTTDRDTMVGVRFLQETKNPFDARVLVKKGITKLNISLSPLPEWARGAGIDPKGGPVKELMLYFYKPQKGAVFYIDRLRIQESLSKKYVSNSDHPINLWYKSNFTVLGGKKAEPVSLKNLSGEFAEGFYDKQLGAKTPDELEKLIRANFLELQKLKPSVRLAILRDDEKGIDPNAPAKDYKGWQNAYISTHSPDAGMTLTPGLGGRCELFMRHRVQLYSVDVSILPVGSEILQAFFVLTSEKDAPGGSLYIAEAINRNWNDSEVTAYTYDKDKFWSGFGGLIKTGSDPDCLPIILAYGYRKDKVSAWDFTEAVKYWTGGKDANHGFFFPCLDGGDYCATATKNAKNIKDRPALFVIYNPKQ